MIESIGAQVGRDRLTPRLLGKAGPSQEYFGRAHLGAAPTGIQPKDMLYIRDYPGYVYIPGIPSPVASKQTMSPNHWFASLVPALLRQPYQPDDYSGHVGAPAAPRSKPGFARQSYRSQRFGNGTDSYMNLAAPKPTWNGLAPAQRLVPAIGRMTAATIPGANDANY